MLTINREKSKVDENIFYEVWINGINMGSLENGKLKNLDLKNGNYKMQIRSSKMVSKVVEFSITNGSYVEYKVKPVWKGTTASLLFYTILKGKKGINLELKQDIYL